MKKRVLETLSVALIITLILASLPAIADNNKPADGGLSIKVGHSTSEFRRKGIELAIYLVATGDYGDWTMLDEYDGIEAFTRKDGSSSVSVTLENLLKRIEQKKIKPTRKGKTDSNGKVEFENLEHGIYFLVMLSGPEGLTMSPRLLATPNKEGKLKFSAEAKYVYVTPTPSPTPTPKPTITPYTTPTPTGSVTPSAKPTPTPKATPSPQLTTPPPPNTLPPHEGETPIPIDEYDTALGLDNIQMHVGVCFE